MDTAIIGGNIQRGMTSGRRRRVGDITVGCGQHVVAAHDPVAINERRKISSQFSLQRPGLVDPETEIPTKVEDNP
jgi:hypothetical protein